MLLSINLNRGVTLRHSHIHQWNHWLAQFLGKSLLEAEKSFLSQLLANHYGKHVVLIGADHQHVLLEATVMSNQVLISPHIYKRHQVKYIESDLNQLPIATGGAELVLLPHTLEYVDNPHQLLAEACRIVKPEGHILILGFNPYSLWGINKWFGKRNLIPWKLNFISPGKIKKWLSLADFRLVKQANFLYRPPVNHPVIYEKLKILEKAGKFMYAPFGSVYMIMAQAKVIPLTPIRLHWKQRTSGVPAPLRSNNGYI